MGVQAPRNRVELDVRTADLVLVVDVKQIEALDLVLAGADVREGPVPCKAASISSCFTYCIAFVA